MYRRSHKQIAAFLAAALIGAGAPGITPVFALDDAPMVAAEVEAGTTVEGTHVTYMDDVKMDDVDTVMKAYLSLPAAVKAKLVSDDVRIIMYDKLEGPATKMTYAASSYSSPEYVNYDEGTKAVVANKYYAKQEIKGKKSGRVRINNALIRISSGKYEGDALLHSVGHWIDDMNSADGKRLAASSNDGFADFYKKYSGQVRKTDKYAAVVISNPTEMFADCVRIFILNPKALQEISPELYAYISTAITVAVNNG